MRLEYLLQTVAGVGESCHLAVERRDLVVQGADEFLLVLDVLLRQLQFVERSTLIFLGLLEHLVGLLYLGLQLFLFLLQVFDIVGCQSRTKDKGQKTKD